MGWSRWPGSRSRPADGPPRHPKDRPVQAASGLWVRSGGERQIANWLDGHGIPYRYEARVAGLRPDFHIPDQDVVVEYWGMAGHRRYDDRMAVKTARYEDAGLEVVHVLPLNLRDLDEVLGPLAGGSGHGRG